MLQAFEWYLDDDGNYYKWLKDQAEDLKKKGIGAIWLPPVFKATGTNDVGYGVYDLYDLGEFNQNGSVRTKYGSLDELRDLIRTLHENDILVYADVVLNHKAGADYTEVFKAVIVDENDRNKQISEPMDIEAWTGFDFPGRDGKFSEFVWSFEHFSGVDYDQRTDTSAIFKILHHDRDWNTNVSEEKGNYDYLMFADIDLTHPDVKEELFSWARWFVEYIDIDGMRFDALKHMDDNFITEFVKNLEDSTDKDLYFFGEYWENDPDSKDKYLYETKYKTDLFDVVLHFNMHEASIDSDNYDMRRIFDGTLVKNHKHMAITFVDNHDSQPGQALESFVQPWFKKIAYGLILLRPDGYPCIFYGDYYGIKKHQLEGHKDMIDNLIQIRKSYVYGKLDDYFEEKDLIGWVLHGDEDHPGSLAVLISTSDAKTLRMYVGEDQAGKEYIDLTGGNTNPISINDDGFGDFEVGPGTLAAWAENI